MNEKGMGVHFGALAAPIEKQLEEQGLKASPESIEKFNNLNHARLTLLFNSCLADSENNKIIKKIFNQLKRSVKSIN